MLTAEEIKKFSKEYCVHTQMIMDCDNCPFADVCVPIYVVSSRWWEDGTADTWKSGFQIWLEEQVGAKEGARQNETNNG